MAQSTTNKDATVLAAPVGGTTTLPAEGLASPRLNCLAHNKVFQNMPADNPQSIADSRGYSIIELLIVVTMVTIVTGWALLGVNRSQRFLRLTNAGTELRNYVEKARADSIRRHARNSVGSNAPAGIQITSAQGYTVTIDADNDGVPEARSITLPQNVSFNLVSGAPLPSVVFDWRGRTSGNTNFSLINGSDNPVIVTVSGAGDVAANTTFNASYTTNATSTSSDVDKHSVLTPKASPTP